jgi:hypothetical protein
MNPVFAGFFPGSNILQVPRLGKSLRNVSSFHGTNLRTAAKYQQAVLRDSGCGWNACNVKTIARQGENAFSAPRLAMFLQSGIRAAK